MDANKEQIRRAKTAEALRSRCPIGGHGRVELRLTSEAEKAARFGLARILSNANRDGEGYDWDSLDGD